MCNSTRQIIPHTILSLPTCSRESPPVQVRLRRRSNESDNQRSPAHGDRNDGNGCSYTPRRARGAARVAQDGDVRTRPFLWSSKERLGTEDLDADPHPWTQADRDQAVPKPLDWRLLRCDQARAQSSQRSPAFQKRNAETTSQSTDPPRTPASVIPM